MPLTKRNILNQIREYSTTGWDLHFLPQLPENLDQFKNSYLVINKNYIPQLYYIKPDGKCEEVPIKDLKLFQKHKNEILYEKDKTFFQNGMIAKVHLTEEEVKKIITSNGEHIPTKKVASFLFKKPEHFKALYEGCDQYAKAQAKKIKQFERTFGELDSLRELNKEDKCYFRKALMEYTTKRIQDKGDALKYKVQDPDIRETDPKLAAIPLEEMLGKAGVALYHAALQEEANDKAFREAVFCNSATYFKGDEWKERPIVIVSGPSACGKSFAAKAAVDKSLDFLATKKSSDSSQGNYVIAADGGVVREVSQIRKWLIKEANQLGYTGEADLHEHSQILESVKKNVLQQALDLSNLGVVIPETFSKWFVPGNAAKKMMEKIEKLTNTRVIFARVEGENPSIFQKVVAFMGSSRAWKNFTTDTTEIDKFSYADLNAKEGVPESKSYGPKGFHFGVMGSLAAEKWFTKNSKENLRMVITNDLILLKPKDTNKFDAGWMPAEPNDKGVIKLPSRAYEDWKNRDASNKDKDLQLYYKENQGRYGSIIQTSLEIDLNICIKQIEKLTESKDSNFSKLVGLKTRLEDIRSITKIPVETLSHVKDFIEVLSMDTAHERKWGIFETEAQKIRNRSLHIIDNAIKAKLNQVEEQDHEETVSSSKDTHLYGKLMDDSILDDTSKAKSGQVDEQKPNSSHEKAVLGNVTRQYRERANSDRSETEGIKKIPETRRVMSPS